MSFVSLSSNILLLKKLVCLEHSHQVSSNYSILPSQNLLYHLYHTILHHSQHLNFYFPILLIKIIYLPNIKYIFSFFFFPIFSSPRVYIFQTFLYFSPSSKLLHTRLHYSQAPSTFSTAPPFPSHHHRASTMPATPPLPTIIPPEQKPILKKKKTQINPDQNPNTAAIRSTTSPPPLNQRFLHLWSTHHWRESQHHNRKKKKKTNQPWSKPRHRHRLINTTVIARSMFPLSLINPNQPIIDENHSIMTGKKKNPDQCFLHYDVWYWYWEENGV